MNAHVTDPHFEIRLLSEAPEMKQLVEVFQQVWGTSTTHVPVELLVAIAHSGGYVAAAFDLDDGRIVGASVGILARHLDRPALHSHITGLLPGVRDSGVGRALKLHQRAWAADHGIDWIVWTFDPLVRRNAWFNIAVLGAEVHQYLPSFYGDMHDAINSGDDSDRLLVAWATDAGADTPGPHDGGAGDASASTRTVATPEDVVALRRTDPVAVARWRAEVREAFTTAFAAGERVIGFTRAGDYVFGPPT